ncbi:MAG: 6-phosphogluconolactonase [Nitrospiraceae bacterium]
MTGTPEVRILNDVVELAQEAADLIVWLGEQAIAGRGRFVLALSGGTTPKILYATLAGPEFSKRLDWSRVAFFFGDERCVPPDHPDSNFGMADATLFQPLGISSGHIFRMNGEDSRPEEAARQYEATLRKELRAAAPAWPVFDLLLLGMGEDGHVASLFPETRALEERSRLVVTNPAPQGTMRLTMTLGVINHAGNVLLLVTGKNKAGAARAVLEGRPIHIDPLPAAMVRPEKGRLIWFLDQAAAAELHSTRQGLTSHEE